MPRPEIDGLARLPLDVSRETLERLEVYVSLVRRWSPKINLVAKSTLDTIWTRHIVDSAQVAALAPDRARTWADLGSGAGFPGIVVAILKPEFDVTCIESDQRKAAFLRTVVRETGLSARVLAMRIEDAPPQGANVVSARALAPLKTLCPMIERHLAQDGTALLPKGRSHDREVREARKTWTFDCTSVPSLTDPDAVILTITNLAHA